MQGKIYSIFSIAHSHKKLNNGPTIYSYLLSRILPIQCIMEIDYERGVPNLKQLKIAQIYLIEQFMAEFPEEKIVVFDKEVLIIFNSIIDFAKFKQYNVSATFYTNNFQKCQNKFYLYFVLPTNESILFMNKYRNFLTNGENKHIICFVGKRDAKIETNLHHNYIWNYLRVRELDITMVVCEYDCINMNIHKSIHKLFIDDDIKTIKHILYCIESIQYLYGEIPEIVSYGNLSTKLKDMIITENKINQYPVPTEATISKLIIIDRLLDTITPCLTQLTYEGAIDDIVGITNGQVFIKNRYVPMNSGCPYYQDARDKSLNVSNILLESYGNSCSLNLKYYDTDYDETTLAFLSKAAKKNMEINKYLQAHVELRSILGKTISNPFWAKLVEIEHLILKIHKEWDSLALLNETVENTELRIIDFIDKSITDKKPLCDILGCLCIYLQIYGKNMSDRGYSTLIEELANKYDNSYEIINYMEKLGLMAKKKISIDNDLTFNSFRKISKKLNLLKKININNPSENDLCTICAGYAPILGKIIEKEKQYSNNANDPIMVLFVGGCNYSEISCCRLLGNVIVLTTEIFNKNQFFNSI